MGQYKAIVALIGILLLVATFLPGIRGQARPVEEQHQQQAQPAAPRIAIIGGGVAAASAAYFLRDLLVNATPPSSSAVDSFVIDIITEAADQAFIGGRLAVADFDGRRFESGGSIIHNRNVYMKHFAERVLNLPILHQNGDVRLAVYNGKETVIDTSDWYLVKMAQLLGRYGISAFIKLRRFVAAMLDDFGRVYARQNLGQAFTSVDALLTAMSDRFVNMSQETIEKVLLDLEFEPEFIDELVAGAMRNNYGQNVTIHGFVGAVSLAGADGGLWSVRGGNRLVPAGLLERLTNGAGGGGGVTGCRLKQGRRVTRISRENDTGWVVTSVDPDRKEEVENYDLVILTAPGHQGFKIQIEGAAIDPVTYQTTIATFVKGTLNHSSLGLASSQERYCLFTGTPVAPLDFNSIGFQNDVEGRASDSVYKVFSQAPLSPSQLNRLFSRVESTRSVSWLAYPLYNSRRSSINASFVLAKGLYHTSPIELAASAMEMAAISGRNAALLAYNDWTGRAAFLTDPHVGEGKGEADKPRPDERVFLRHSEL